MLSTPFYHALLKKYVIVFGTLFNQIYIERESSSGTVGQRFKVPIAYGPREKYLALAENRQATTDRQEIVLPRLGFEIIGFNYAQDRKLQTLGKINTRNNINGQNVYKKVFNPVPYDINFRLSIYSKSTEDGTRILEQILPYFTPEWTVSCKLLEDFDERMDIPLVLNSVSTDDTYDSDYLTRRALVFDLDFTMKVYLYGPVTQSKLIKVAKVNLYPNLTTNTVFDRVTVQPGLTANGEPTSNSAASVPYTSIDEDDNYGYIVTIEEFPNVE